MKDCTSLTNDVLLDLSRQRLAEEEREGALAHLLDCAACRRRFEEIREIAAAIGRCADAPAEPLMSSLDAAVFDFVSPSPRRRVLISGRWVAGLVSAAAVLTLGLFGYLHLQAPRPSPPVLVVVPLPPEIRVDRPVPSLRFPGASSAVLEDLPESEVASLPGGLSRPAEKPAPNRGDLNGDGEVDDRDDEILVQAILGGRSVPAALELRPGEGLDVANVWVLRRLRADRPAHRAGDLNGDGAVDTADRRILEACIHEGAALPDPRSADLDGNCLIDDGDLAILKEKVLKGSD